VGPAEIGILLFVVAALAATVWLPPAGLRALAGVWTALAAAMALRPLLGAAGGIGVALALAAAAAWRLPERLLRRIAFAVPSLLLLVFVTTLLMYLAPGSPFANERAAPPGVEEVLRAQYGVPETPSAFTAIYLRRLLVEGTLGPAIKVQGRQVEDLLLPALPVSLSLGVLALVLAVVMGVVLGVRAGLRPGSAEDVSSMALALVGISLPNFVIGALFMIVFALHLGWLPVAGWGGYGHLVMPAITLALPYAAYVARLARGGTIEVMQQDYIRTARAKGLPERVVVIGHALRGALLPVVSFLGPAAAGIMTGSFVVETLFGVPGMGQWFVKGAINRDYSVVLGTALVYFGLITLFNLAVDLALAWLDPRVRDEL
jgi:oligopeptide transport system permease protein